VESTGRKSCKEDCEICVGGGAVALVSVNVKGYNIRGDGVRVAGIGPHRREGFHVTVGDVAGGGVVGRSVDGVVGVGGACLGGALGSGRVVKTSEVETVAWSLGAGRLFVTSRRRRATRLAAG
jgi:hypothetical protein